MILLQNPGYYSSPPPPTLKSVERWFCSRTRHIIHPRPRRLYVGGAMILLQGCHALHASPAKNMFIEICGFSIEQEVR